MMMAQPFPVHQAGMAHHPVMPPGHPMAAGQHPNAAHLAGQGPGAGIVQQMHPGVSTPGGQQVTQGGPVMGGMPPGTTGPGGPGPSAHALSHLGPTHGHQMFPPQQMGQACKLFFRTPFFIINSALQSPFSFFLFPLDIYNLSLMLYSVVLFSLGIHVIKPCT